MRSWSAAVLVFCTSAAVLVIEILAGRLMAPYVGESLETYTGIIGTVLAGIAVGSAAGGRLADLHDPRRLLGPTVLLGGVLAWLALPIVTALGPMVGSGPAAIVLLSGAAFLLPAAVLSTVGPMAAKLRLDDLGDTGSVVGGLSAAGTAGALAGTFITGFVLVAALPTRPIIMAVGALLVVAGLVMWVRLTSARPARVGAAAVLGVGLLGSASPSPCEHETSYFCVRVEADPDRASGRILWLDNLRHSYVDLDDPTYLGFRYVRLFRDVADSLGAGPLDVLHIGGGGFTFPRYLEATRPGSTNLVLEIDGELPRIAEDELGLDPDSSVDIDVGDARLALGELPTNAYDLVVGDAFGGLSVPWHLTTVEVLREVQRTLRPGGVYVINVIDGGPNRFARAEVASLQEVFGHVAVIVPPGGVGSSPVNQILVAGDRSLPPLSIDAEDGELLTGPHVDAFVAGARPLVDDFAPVDQLLTRR